MPTSPDPPSLSLRGLSVEIPDLPSPPPSGSREFLVDLSSPNSTTKPLPASPDLQASTLYRSSSIRSVGSAGVLPSPITDFQTDEVLNRPSRRNSRRYRPPRQTDGVPQLIQADLDRANHGLTAHIRMGGTGATGSRTPTYAGGWNPFVPPGLDGWTRETWGKRKVALISGITGQDGSYLTELLIGKGYTVHGIIRRSSSFNTSRLHHLYADAHEGPSRMILHYGDLTDSTNLVYIISQVQPSEIYNLGAQSHVKVSFEMAEYTGDVDGLGTLRLLDAVRTCGLEKLVRFYQASTSELYGAVRETPQNENTPFYPRSPYGVAKLYAYWTVVNYREAYGMFASNGILFNHESPRRGRTFVTRKITRAVAEISLGKQDCMYMGNLDAMRDWGHAYDYVEGMWRILQHDDAQDFVLASGESHSVREFIEKSFAVVGIRIRWQGKDIDEVGIDEATNNVVIRVDPKYFRPAEVDHLLGDPSKAEKMLGWKRTIDFEQLVREMVLSDVASAKYLVEDHN